MENLLNRGEILWRFASQNGMRKVFLFINFPISNIHIANQKPFCVLLCFSGQNSSYSSFTKATLSFI